jgi:hypothetical protein
VFDGHQDEEAECIRLLVETKVVSGGRKTVAPENWYVTALSRTYCPTVIPREEVLDTATLLGIR